MTDLINTPKPLTDVDRVKNLFTYLSELAKLKTRQVIHYSRYRENIELLPYFYENKFITIYERTSDVTNIEGDPLIKVRFPTTTPRPEIPVILIPYSYQSLDGYLVVDAEKVKNLQDQPEIQAAYASWEEKIKEWQAIQREEQQARDLFNRLMNIRRLFQRDTEPLELIAANVTIASTNTPELLHPLFIKPVEITYLDDENAIQIQDSSDPASIYSSHLGSIKYLNTTDLNKYEHEISDSLFHPFNHSLAHSTAERLLHSCSPNSCVFEHSVSANVASQYDVYGYMQPMLILRDKPSGISALAEQIRDSISSLNEVPAHLQQLIGIVHERQVSQDEQPTLERRLADAGGEDPEILLAKPANTEQLNIARMIERNNAVIVQGPPGTGKTHTIANLIGHFLAQGKTVLVTSEKTKALSVLKDKIDPAMQPLCVSLVGNSTADLRRSIEVISSTMNMGVSSRKTWVRQYEEQRNQIIKEINEIRLKLFNSLEDEEDAFYIDDEEFYPIDAAQYVAKNQHLPARYGFYANEEEPFPFTSDNLSTLYRLNTEFDDDFRALAKTGLPDPALLLVPQDFSNHVIQSQKDRKTLDTILQNSSITIDYDAQGYPQGFSYNASVFGFPSAEGHAIEEFSLQLDKIAAGDVWAKELLASAKDQLTYQRWNKVVEAADYIEELQLSNMEALSTHVLDIDANLNYEFAIGTLNEIKGDLSLRRLKLKLKKLSDKEGWIRREQVLSSLSLDGQTIDSLEDANIAIAHLTLRNAQNTLRQYWSAFTNDLSSQSLPDLDTNRPERTITNFRTQIDNLFYWGIEGIESAIKEAFDLGFPIDRFINIQQVGSSGEQLVHSLEILKGPISSMAKATSLIRKIKYHEDVLNKQLDILCHFPGAGNNRLIQGLINSITQHSDEEYEKLYIELEQIYPRLKDWTTYQDILEQVHSVSPLMATQIASKHTPHDKDAPPEDLQLAWKTSRIIAALNRIDSVPYQELQARGAELSKKYRELTSKLASNKAWIALNDRVTGNAFYQQALQSWSTTMKKRGKGTGARAQKYEREARDLMKKCQKAVPAWIMTVNQAASMFDPASTRFDVIIIDEASQSDVTALVMAFLGKKVVVVGDDEQVSPLAVGVEDRQVEMLDAQYLKDSVENRSLYTPRDSLYDIAKTTFNQLMLREHFRCVPQIIGFSNQLSYNGAIKPLREKNDTDLLPATVSYHVNGIRDNKKNNEEADAIAALMRACIDEPTYKGKTFGVISMLGNEQLIPLQQAIDKALTRHEIEERKVLVGNSADFQGDERDVIFLSLVDSNEGDGPLRLTRDGSNESIKKRYNVAASRAKDQLWVVHSLNPADDLKPGDIRRELIEYAQNPESLEAKEREIHDKSDSPFEEEVARALVSKGYTVEQQYEVGAYRIDMALFTSNKKIAIECDGERWHSGSEKISEDLERQTILERLGWTFIRIRGSEYYRDKTGSIERVVSQLESLNVPIGSSMGQNTSESKQTSKLLERIIEQSERYRESEKNTPSINDKIAARNYALSDKTFKSKKDKTTVHQVATFDGQNVSENSPINPHSSRSIEFEDTSNMTIDRISDSKNEYIYLNQTEEDDRTFTEYFNSIFEDKDELLNTQGNEKSEGLSVNLPDKKTSKRNATPVKPSKPKPNRKQSSSSTKKRTQESNLSTGQEDWVIAELRKNYLKYVDQRCKNGCLWVKGGRELGALMCRLKKQGAIFKLKESGCRAFKGASAWHLDNYPVQLTETVEDPSIPSIEGLKPGTLVLHKSFGAGKIVHIDQQAGRLVAFIGGKERTFHYPEVFSSGLLSIK